MSYDDQPENAHTPMILDVIALQQAYGEGAGTHGAANDTIAAGNLGYRVYFDKGGVDTIDLAMYESGAYLHMGATSQGAAHLVGVAMSRRDGDALASGSNPAYLRWFYGEYENAKGASFDEIIGNSLANVISGLGGNDEIDGGGGIDTVVFTGLRSQYSVILRSDGTINVADLRLAASDGTDTLTNVEFLQFSDLTMAAPAPNKPPTVAAVAPTRRWVPTPRWR
jgi:Ca2+-binding RTX toxin-like protein